MCIASILMSSRGNSLWVYVFIFTPMLIYYLYLKLGERKKRRKVQDEIDFIKKNWIKKKVDIKNVQIKSSLDKIEYKQNSGIRGVGMLLGDNTKEKILSRSYLVIELDNITYVSPPIYRDDKWVSIKLNMINELNIYFEPNNQNRYFIDVINW